MEKIITSKIEDITVSEISLPIVPTPTNVPVILQVRVVCVNCGVKY